jgi:metal-responsive CopG/Arc/MetJ family transcriptional regulator
MATPATEAQAKPQAIISQAVQASTPTGTTATKVMPTPLPTPAPLPALSNPAIVVPVVTFFGVLLTIWFGRWKTKTELTDSRERWGIDRNDALDRIKTDREHAAEEARRERLTTARREVYLELIKEMTAASMALGGMPFQKGEDLDIQGGFQGFISAVARVAILGEMNTVLKSRELMNLVQQILYKKMPEIVEMRLVRTEQTKFNQANKLQLERSEGIKEFIKELIKDRKGETLNDWSELLTASDEKAKEYAATATTCQEAHAARARAYQRSMVDDTAEIAVKTNELIACIREELELKTDATVLASSTVEMYASAKDAIEKMYKPTEE